ncbi:MAG: hypothetical protein FJ135_12085 [Deltaproteobacteria bacterium]|nr:hypothetical protein [Deltaproteobacteria bacterium]
MMKKTTPHLAELLRLRLADCHARLAQVRGVEHLAQTLAREAGAFLILEDHPWLRAAAAFLSDYPDKKTQVVSKVENWAGMPAKQDTVVIVGLGAVPETGSLLLSDHSQVGWWLSLCPCRQIVVIPEDHAFLTMTVALELTAREPSGLVSWITGPSRTADIEKVLVLGAQGATDLLVITFRE